MVSTTSLSSTNRNFKQTLRESPAPSTPRTTTGTEPRLRHLRLERASRPWLRDKQTTSVSSNYTKKTKVRPILC